MDTDVPPRALFLTTAIVAVNNNQKGNNYSRSVSVCVGSFGNSQKHNTSQCYNVLLTSVYSHASNKTVYGHILLASCLKQLKGNVNVAQNNSIFAFKHNNSVLLPLGFTGSKIAGPKCILHCMHANGEFP